MLAAWTILVNRRQEKPIFTKPTFGEGRKVRPSLRFVTLAPGTLNHRPTLSIQYLGATKVLDGSSKSKC
jgi:hypothetical protein